MPIRSKGLRSKTRGILTKSARKRGVASPNKVLRDHPVGSRVAVVHDPAQHHGMVHKRFQGETGVVTGRQGDAFVIDIKHGRKPKQLVVRAEHLKAIR